MSSRSRTVILAAWVVKLAACGPPAPVDDVTLYRRAIEDALEPRPDEIRQLLPVRRDTPGLRWDARGERLAVITFEKGDLYGPVDGPLSGYPWTQLGATYDWSASSTGHHGPSELVISVGASIEVERAGSAADYCGG